MNSKPKPAGQVSFAPGTLLDIRDYVMECLQAYEHKIVRTCLTCTQFNEHREGCALAQWQRPPARVIAFGCPSYLHEDEIPF